jgi:hypothetical protein
VPSELELPSQDASRPWDPPWGFQLFDHAVTELVALLHNYPFPVSGVDDHVFVVICTKYYSPIVGHTLEDYKQAVYSRSLKTGTMDDPFAYYVPQTPCDYSQHNSFFRRSSPNNPTQFINLIQDGISTRLRNIGRGSEAEPPLQLRVSSLEDTIDSVHLTVHALETTMSEIVTLLRGSKHPTAENLQTSHSVAPTADDTLLPTPTPVASPQVSTPMAHHNYRDAVRRTPAPAVPIISTMSTPTVARGLRPNNGSTTVPPEFDSEMKSPMGQQHRSRQEFISGHYCWHSRQFDIHDGKGYSRFQVVWLHHNIDGPYEGKPDKLQKLSLSPLQMTRLNLPFVSMRLQERASAHVDTMKSYCLLFREPELVSM